MSSRDNHSTHAFQARRPHRSVTIAQAQQRLRELANEGGFVSAAAVEADELLAADRATTAAAAQSLATETGVMTGGGTDAREWFPYSFLRFEPGGSGEHT